jgi:hypothetical protein
VDSYLDQHFHQAEAAELLLLAARVDQDFQVLVALERPHLLAAHQLHAAAAVAQVEELRATLLQAQAEQVAVQQVENLQMLSTLLLTQAAAAVQAELTLPILWAMRPAAVDQVLSFLVTLTQIEI